MITTNTDGDPISQAFAAAMAEPSVMYSMKLYRNGSDLGAVIKRAKLDLGAGQLSDDLGTFAACGVYQTQFSASLYDCPSILGDELEVRVGVLAGNAYEYVAVAYVTITEESVWKGVTDVRGVGRMGLMHAPHGLAEGDYQPAAIAAAIYAATGILVSIDVRLTTQSVHADAGGTCRDALESMCARLGAFACELGEGVAVMPYSSTATGTIPTGHVTGKPELGALYEVDGITVEAGEESFVQGTGRVHIVDGTATATTAAATWGNMRGYAFTPATLNIALIDPRWTVADTLEVTLGEDDYSISARGISITYDGGYFGTVSAAGLTAEAEEMAVEGPLTRSVGYARSVADEALAVAEATNQHFWQRSTDPSGDGAGTGAFVTDEEQDSFLEAIAQGIEPTSERPLHNLLMNSLGILLRAATRIRAAFIPNGVRFYDDYERNMAEFGRRLTGIYNLTSYYSAWLKLTSSNGLQEITIDSGGPTAMGDIEPISITANDAVTVDAPEINISSEGNFIASVDDSGNAVFAGGLTLGSPLTIANGGTGADNASDARSNLYAVGYATGMDAAISNFIGATQLFGLNATCINANNTLNGKRASLIVRNEGLSGWNISDSSQMWSVTFPTSSINFNNAFTSTVAQVITAASGFTISQAGYVQNGRMGQWYMMVKNTNAMSANTQYTIGTIVSGKRPAVWSPVTFGETTNAYGNGRMVTGGGVLVRPSVTIAAGSSFYLLCPAYILG